MHDVTLTQIALFLAAAVVAAPIAKLLRIGNVLGYLLVGVLIGPAVLGLVSDVNSVLHFAEFGVIMLLFVIGLELRPKRLWAMRTSIFGLGSLQVALTGLVLAGVAMAFGLVWQAALFAGLALALSSTAFALQVLEEKGELALRHGRLAFAVLLFQDLAAIPLIALVPLFAVAVGAAAQPMEAVSAAKAIGVILAVVVVGRYLLDGMFRLIARTRVKEAMTASALLTVVGVTLVMQLADLPASLGAFIAGVLLADSDYRHEIMADIAPFEGLLLGLFFTAIGMSLNLGLIAQSPYLVAAIVAGLVAIKSAILFGLGRRMGLESAPARRLALVLSQGGEFAFALFAAGTTAGVLERPVADLLSVAVTLSMAATPLLLLIDERLAPKVKPARAFDEMPDNDGHVVIAGFGRVGQIVARILSAKRIPVTALELQPRAGRLRAQVRRADFLRRRQPSRNPGSCPDRQGARLRACHRRHRGIPAHGPRGAAQLSRCADLCPRPHAPARAPADGRRHQDHSPRDVSRLGRLDARGVAWAWSARTRSPIHSRHLPGHGSPPSLRGLQALYRHRKAPDGCQKLRPGARGAVRKGCG